MKNAIRTNKISKYLLSLVTVVALGMGSQAFCMEIEQAIKSGDTAKFKEIFNNSSYDQNNKQELLVKACLFDNKQIIQFLFDNGADVNKANNSGQIPIDIVLLSNNNPNVFKMFIYKGVEINDNNRGKLFTIISLNLNNDKKKADALVIKKLLDFVIRFDNNYKNFKLSDEDKNDKDISKFYLELKKSERVKLLDEKMKKAEGSAPVKENPFAKKFGSKKITEYDPSKPFEIEHPEKKDLGLEVDNPFTITKKEDLNSKDTGNPFTKCFSDKKITEYPNPFEIDQPEKKELGLEVGNPFLSIPKEKIIFKKPVEIKAVSPLMHAMFKSIFDGDYAFEEPKKLITNGANVNEIFNGHSALDIILSVIGSSKSENNFIPIGFLIRYGAIETDNTKELINSLKIYDTEKADILEELKNNYKKVYSK